VIDSALILARIASPRASVVLALIFRPHEVPSDLEPSYPGDLHSVGLSAIVAGAVACL
jgi:hypothetical protein